VNTAIKDIAYVLPERVVTNDELRRDHPQWDLDRVETRTGVRRRHVAGDAETALDLGERAARRLFEAHPGLAGRIDGLLFCTETADYRIPPNACVLHGRLGLPERVLALDVNLGCSGFPYCVAVARGLVGSGACRDVLVVNADTYSKVMDPQDQAVQVLFGDGAAATWLAASDGHGGVLDVDYGTAGKYHDKFIIPQGGCRAGPVPAGARAPDKICMDGRAVLAFTSSKIPQHVRAFLERNGLGVDRVDLFVFHQASRMVLDSLAMLLRIKPGQLFSNLEHVGNTVSASIPIGLKDALDAGRVAPGQTVLLCGFGLGLSWGSVLLRW
jgi:3-oxoacyl-[acyl-carrier-protein] synthase-3